MKIININSKYEITKAQQSFAEEIIYIGEYEPYENYDSISVLTERIPIFLLSPDSMPNEYDDQYKKPATEYLGFYQHSFLVPGTEIPAIYLCPERIISQVKNDEELTILIAKVIIHEFAHAKMRMDPSADYSPIDEFYQWMEEPMANFITLEYFANASKTIHSRYLCGQPLLMNTKYMEPINFVKKFISMQPPNYRLGLDLFKHGFCYWWIWRNRKKDIQNKAIEKQNWLDYVKKNVGRTNKKKLEALFEALALYNVIP